MIRNIVDRKIMWGDLDALGIVFYPRYYEWIDASGHLFFESIGLNLGDLRRERSLLFGLVETSCRYFNPGRYHQNIRICTQISRLGSKTVTLKHDLTLETNDTPMVEGIEHRICMDVTDTEKLRAVDIPKDIYMLFENATSSA